MKLKLLLNGEVEIRFPDGTSDVVPVDRLTILNDFADELDNAVSDGYADEFSEEGFPYDTSAATAHGLDGGWTPQGSPDGHMEHEAWKHLDESVCDEMALMDVDSGERASTPVSELRPSSSLSSTMRSQLSSTMILSPSSFNLPRLESHFVAEHDWRSFVILPSAQRDHAFISEPPATQPTKAFLQRLNKEYKVLSSSLPGEVLLYM
jgi:ubiquitin-conjugating enzyme E2 O